MIGFIVAKDEEEFSKYENGSLKDDSCFAWHDTKIIMRLLKHNDDTQKHLLFVILVKKEKDDVRDNMSTDISTQGTAFIDIIANMVVYVANRHNKQLPGHVAGYFQKKITNKVINIESQEKNAGLDSFQVELSVIKDEDLTLFVHWGEGAPLFYEDKFNAFLGAYVDNERARVSKIRAYALSSRRAELFDVTGSKIETPKTYDELVELGNRFRNAQVDEAFSHCAAKHDWDVSDAKMEIIDRLDRFAIRVLKSSLNNEKKNELLQAVAKARDEKFENARTTSDETASFFAKILNKEVFNG